MALVAVGLVSGCDSERRPADAKPAASVSQTPPLTQDQLEAALPGPYEFPAGLEEDGFGGKHSWDGTDSTICRSENWPASWCARATALASSAASATSEGRQLSVRLLSFRSEKDAAKRFLGDTDPAEVGHNPPGDEILRIHAPDDDTHVYPGEGYDVRQGAIVGQVRYVYKDGDVPPGQTRAITKMVAKRIQQVQRGETPTASVR
ncbi:hypothetical protein [Streptomyces qinglanensis]|uniref:hypothetical protein n=1 Tax=Streptomyces qinglanensis TaxID=943816 RepID=UPI00379F8A13